MPVEVEVKFDNGEKVREHWDGQSRWTRFATRKKRRSCRRRFDPDHTIMLDRDNFNNSFVVEPNPKADEQAVDLLAFRDAVGQPGAGLVGSISSILPANRNETRIEDRTTMNNQGST